MPIDRINLGNALTQKTAEGQFQPTNDQKRAKSAFWGSFTEQSVVLPGDTPNLSLVLQFLVNEGKITEWWAMPGFPAWFWNNQEFNQRKEYIASLAMDELEKVLLSNQLSPDKKIQAIRLSLELSGKLDKQEGAAPIDSIIGKMNREQLREYINKRTRLTSVPSELSELPELSPNSTESSNIK